MKKIAMFTMGTRGDVQPYIYLSKGLMKAGFDVTLGTHPCWKNLVESFGVHFEPVGPDIDIEEETSIIRGKSSNAMMSLLKTMNFIMKIIEGSSKEVYEICKGKDLIIVTHSQMGAVEAGVLGIPKVNVTLQTEMIGEKLRKQKFSEKVDVPSSVLMQCTDPEAMLYSEDIVIPTGNYSPELLFVGNSRGVFRKILRDVLPTDHDLHVYGRHWEKFPEVQEHVIANYIDNDKVAGVYHNARILLNDHWDDMREYGIISNRIFDAMCAGAFVISDDVPGLEEAFGECLVTYTDRKDLSDKIDYYLTHEFERMRIARAGRKRVLNKHTFDDRAEKIAEVIEADKYAKL